MDARGYAYPVLLFLKNYLYFFVFSPSSTASSTVQLRRTEKQGHQTGSINLGGKQVSPGPESAFDRAHARREHLLHAHDLSELVHGRVVRLDAQCVRVVRVERAAPARLGTRARRGFTANLAAQRRLALLLGVCDEAARVAAACRLVATAERPLALRIGFGRGVRVLVQRGRRRLHAVRAAAVARGAVVGGGGAGRPCWKARERREEESR